MTKPDEQTLERVRLQLALLDGWQWEVKFSKRKPKNILWGPTGSCVVWRDGLLGGSKPPDYCGDLTSAHKAASRLCRDLETGVRFMQHLEEVVCPSTGFELQMAQAYEVAIALDRTLSKEPIV